MFSLVILSVYGTFFTWSRRNNKNQHAVFVGEGDLVHAIWAF
jgi:hypothetical protein